MTLVKGGMFDRRGFLKTTAVAAAASALPLGGAMAEPKRGGHLRVAKGHGQTTDTLDPGQWENGYMIALSFGVHGRLTEVAQDGSVQPELAESWEASDDASEWRFKLRKGVTFHSGKPVTVEDVVASINHHRGEDSTSAAGPIVAPIQELTTEGDDTVIFKLDGGNADFPFILTDYHLAICPAKEGGGIDWKSGDGCGAYVLKDFNAGVSSQFERNENHWRDDVGWFDSIETLVVVDQNARTTALVSGDVHAIDKVDLKSAGLLERNKAIKIESIAGTQHYTFAMTVTKDPFTDNNIRQALKYAINREELVEKILFGYGSVGNDHPIGPGQRYFNSELEQKVYDPDKAKWYLKEAGVDSVSVQLSASDAAYPGAVDAAVLYQASAKTAGINIDVKREANDGYWSDIWMKKPFTAVYWGGRPVEDQMFATAYKCGADWNDTFWCNERFEELMVKARAELDDAKRREMYFEMQDILANQGGAIIPMFANYVFAITDKIGHGEYASNWDMDGERWMERWWFA
ncbi:ABC transporter substrate-binding protein [Roseovarius spongiae]|uniref:ABC transporter substrate-binding protein n=1 Tax=Roseovarius spongiae TaxID=2320272 RepID=A0A3A8B5J2_9RHOB|nr:ABC transporter substrate-binding protein [Roseovarius spongiae]RKF14906.1 ABC transporter substrate-binding protein [Roseovarius spongiae]